MSMYLIKGDNPKLKKVCEEVEIPRGIKLGRKLLKYSKTVRAMYGLTASQVGLLVRVLVIRFNGTEEIVINPVISNPSRKKVKMKEGCLTHPKTRTDGIKVKRSFEVDVAYYDGNGHYVEKRVSGMLARVFQHEVDHLDGICIVDK